MIHVGWSALSVGFLALCLAVSINQALNNGVEDIGGCESFQPIYGGALLHHVYQTLKVPGSIYCLRACDDDTRELKQQTFLSSRTSDCRGGLDRQRRFWREILMLSKTRSPTQTALFCLYFLTGILKR